MNTDEQVLICKAIAKSCMWGHGGIGSVITDKLQKSLPTDPSWQEVYTHNEKQAKYEAVGVVKDEEEIESYLRLGYPLYNYSPGELQIHNKREYGGGLHKYILGDLANKYGELYDPHNFKVVQYRKANGLPP